MPVKADASVWKALLNACQLHSATKLAGAIYMLQQVYGWSQVHCFVAGDTSHLQSDIIYASLNSLLTLIKESGYIPDLRLVLRDEEG
ncbi:hypothetical protein PRUPE_7G129200 [Prunus persica]|uniref:Uncharacterized protein n=1 Tax=Prunus persica TaxID=3760 RepID=M5WFV8_PRUPE|nr:hypothetical protein PRUPE_7G129200 [Prunus persica]